MTHSTIRFVQERYSQKAEKAMANAAVEFHDRHSDAEIDSMHVRSADEDAQATYEVTINGVQ